MKYSFFVILVSILYTTIFPQPLGGDFLVFPRMSHSKGLACCELGSNHLPFYRYFEKDSLIMSDKLQSYDLYLNQKGLFNKYINSYQQIMNDSIWYKHYFPNEVNSRIGVKKYTKMILGLGLDTLPNSYNSCFIRKSRRNIYIYHSGLDNDIGYDELLFFFSANSPKIKWEVSCFPMGEGFGVLSSDIFTVSLERKDYFQSIEDTLFSFKFQGKHECLSPTMVYVSEKYGIVGLDVFHCSMSMNPLLTGNCETWYYPFQ